MKRKLALRGLVLQTQVECVNRTNVRQATRIVANASDQLAGRREPPA